SCPRSPSSARARWHLRAPAPSDDPGSERRLPFPSVLEDVARKERWMRRLVATTGVFTIAVTAGCSGGSSESAQSSSTDAASAARINLQQSDFPAGWQGHPNPVTAPANATVERTLYSCLATPPPESHTTANVNSPA